MASLRGGAFARHRLRYSSLRSMNRRINGEAEFEDRMLTDQPRLKNYGRIDRETKNQKYDVVKIPMEDVLAQYGIKDADIIDKLGK